MKKIHALFLLLLVSPVFSWEGDWEIISVENRGEGLKDYQVLVKLNSTNFNFSKAGGLRFTVMGYWKVRIFSNRTLSDFQIGIPLSYAERGSNFYVSTSENFSDQLPYWTEEGKLWIRLDIPEGVTYVYVRKDESAPKPEGNNVFEFFDDFEEWNESKWKIVQGAGNISFSQGILTIDDPSGTDVRLAARVNFSPPVVMEARIRTVHLYSSSNPIDSSVGLADEASGDFIRYVQDYGSVGNSSWIFRARAQTTRNYYSGFKGTLTDRPFSFTKWTRVEYEFPSWESVKFYIGGRLDVEHNSTLPDSPLSPWIRAYKTKTQVDYIFVRKRGSVSVNVEWVADGKYESDIPFWIEEWKPVEKTAKVWLRIPRIPENGSVGVRMYYGGKEEGNGRMVFEFFDDFEREFEWTTKGAVVSFEGRWIKVLPEGWVYFEKGFGKGSLVEMKGVIPPASELPFSARGFGLYNGSFVVVNSPDPKHVNSHTYQVYEYVAGSNDTVVVNTSFPVSNDTHVFGLAYSNTSMVFMDYEKVGGFESLLKEKMYPAFWVRKNGDYVMADWVRIRKLAEKEPEVKVGGFEIYEGVLVINRTLKANESWEGDVPLLFVEILSTGAEVCNVSGRLGKAVLVDNEEVKRVKCGADAKLVGFERKEMIRPLIKGGKWVIFTGRGNAGYSDGNRFFLPLKATGEGNKTFCILEVCREIYVDSNPPTISVEGDFDVILEDRCKRPEFNISFEDPNLCDKGYEISKGVDVLCEPGEYSLRAWAEDCVGHRTEVIKKIRVGNVSHFVRFFLPTQSWVLNSSGSIDVEWTAMVNFSLLGPICGNLSFSVNLFNESADFDFENVCGPWSAAENVSFRNESVMVNRSTGWSIIEGENVSCVYYELNRSVGYEAEVYFGNYNGKIYHLEGFWTADKTRWTKFVEGGEKGGFVIYRGNATLLRVCALVGREKWDFCGDGICDGWESCSSCSGDCGTCRSGRKGRGAGRPVRRSGMSLDTEKDEKGGEVGGISPISVNESIVVENRSLNVSGSVKRGENRTEKGDISEKESEKEESFERVVELDMRILGISLALILLLIGFFGGF